MAHRLEDNMQELLRSLEQLAMQRQRQLPLRQHGDKRVLKPGGGHGSGPVLLYSPHGVAREAALVLELAQPSAGPESTRGGALVSLPPSANGLRSYNYVQAEDPYSRPLSAKDLMTAGSERTRAKSPLPDRSHAATVYPHSAAVLPHNTFIHPRSSSSVKVEAATAMLSLQASHSGTPLVASASSRQGSAVKGPVGSGGDAGQSVAQVSTASAKQKFEAMLLKSSEASSSAARAPSARPPTAIVRPLSGVRNLHYTPNRPASSEGAASSPNGATNNAEQDAATKLFSADLTPLAHGLDVAAGHMGASQASTGFERSTAPVAKAEEDGSSSAVPNYYRISSKPEVRLSQTVQPHQAAVSTPDPKALPRRHSKSSSGGNASRHRSVAAGSSTKRREGSCSDDEAEDEGDATESSLYLSDRAPGDGEAFDDDEDDGIDCLDDDDLEGTDDDDDEAEQPTVGGSIRARSASASAAGRRRAATQPIRMKSARLVSHHHHQQQHEQADADEAYRSPALGGSDGAQPGLTKSLFSNVPPYINFVTEEERIDPIPWEFRKLLRWRMCSITPIVVKKTIERSGFRATKKHYDWLGCWGKHMKAAGFKSIREYQKLNHFPGSFQIGRKDRLWKNLLKMQVQFGKKEFGFFPQTYVLPSDIKQLQRAWEDCGSKQKWIVKPPASARGIGIKVISKWAQIPKRRPVIVQKYLCRPYLINESKFDLRIYVYVPCYDPLRIYVHEDGLVRFASSKYSHSMKSIGNKYMHLTNFSVNKNNAEYQSNADDSVCQGHKWSLKSLWGYLQKKGVNTATLWKTIKDIIVKTIISSEASVNSCIKANVRSRYSVHELFGFDILLDEELKPWVLEVNISPSLHSSSKLDINVKGAMIKDLHNMAGFRIPDRNDVVPNPGAESYKSSIPSSQYCMDKRLYSSSLTADEKAKHAYYCQRYNDESEIASITDLLTPDDLRILIESIDEDCHKGGFQRVFPTPLSHGYLKFFECPRYYNLLLDQWCQQFNRNESKGVTIIEMGCLRGVHLQNPTNDPLYQWCPPSARTLTATNQMNALLLGASTGLPTVRRKMPNDLSSSSALLPRPPVPPPKRSSVASS